MRLQAILNNINRRSLILPDTIRNLEGSIDVLDSRVTTVESSCPISNIAIVEIIVNVLAIRSWAGDGQTCVFEFTHVFTWFLADLFENWSMRLTVPTSWK